MKKEKGLLSNTGDGLDVDVMIVSIEKTFDINFSDKEDFKNVKIYQDFEDVVLSKINGEILNDCTSQQAFYKLRSIISNQCGIDKSKLILSSSLTEIFPKKNRIKNIAELNKHLNTSIQILTLNTLQSSILVSSFLLGIGFLFFNFWYASIFFIIGFILKDELRERTFCIKNLREFAEKLKIEDYNNSRRNQNSYNLNEVKFVIKSLFAENLCLEFDEIKSEIIL